MNVHSATQGFQFAIFQGGTLPPSWCFRGYFHPLFINLEGMTLCSELLALHKLWVKTQNLILNVVLGFWLYFDTASHDIIIFRTRRFWHGFSQCYNFQNWKITMLEYTGYITELTAWRFYQGHMSDTCVWWGGNRSHFFRLTYSPKF